MIRVKYTRALGPGVVAATAVLVTSVVAAPGTSAAPARRGAALPAKAADQIAALQRIKTSLTPAERKLDSRLAVTVLSHENSRALAATPRVSTAITVGKSGTVSVDIAAAKVSTDLLKRLKNAGAQVGYVSTSQRTIRAAVPETELVTVASWPDVTRVSAASQMITAHETPPTAPAGAESKAERAQRLERALHRTLAATTAGDQGSVVSEGDRTQAADTARANTHVQGIGVKVCALSNGVDSLADSQAGGDLPPDVDVLPDQEGSGDEGTAMLEIIHDLAPRAALGFATANPTDAAFAQNIRDLRFVAGCDVIVDDVLYFDEDPFQDGPIAQAVNDVIADGALYFSSAGNEGNVLDGTSGNFEGNFVNSGTPVGKFSGTANDFAPGSGVQVFEPISDNSSADVPVTLFWADPLGAASDDYDLYLFDADNNVVGFSQDVQDGTQNPFEILFTPDFGGEGLKLAVVKFSGHARYFQLSALRGRFTSYKGLTAYVSPGVTRGHSAAADAFSVAAAPAAGPLPFDLEPGDPPNPTGPHPNVFTGHQAPERFTSDGPRRVFFAADGTPFTPGNFSSTGGQVRRKPDVTAADGVTTSVPDFAPFFGTSAAAPHAAAIAALVLSGNPHATTADVRQAFEATAIDLAPAGVDGRTGWGILRATKVLTFTGATPQPLVHAGSPTVTPLTGDGDRFLEPGESASVSVPATNVGDGPASGVSVRLTDADPQVTIAPHSHGYGTIGVGRTTARTYTLALAAGYPLGKPVQLDVRVSFAGALSPQTSTLTLPTGEPATTATAFSYAGPPVPIPDNSPTGATGTIQVPPFGYAAKVTFSIDGTTCTRTRHATTVGIDHTFVGDLSGTLTAPDGRSVELFDRVGGSGHNLCQVVFRDDATTPIATANSGDAPFTGTWQPDNPIGPLRADPVDGAWTFRVVDHASRDSGTLRAFSLHVTGFVTP